MSPNFLEISSPLFKEASGCGNYDCPVTPMKGELR